MLFIAMKVFSIKQSLLFEPCSCLYLYLENQGVLTQLVRFV